MSEFFEMLMVVAFGISWPLNIVKSLRSRTAKGKSAAFTVLILIDHFLRMLDSYTNSKCLRLHWKAMLI